MLLAGIAVNALTGTGIGLITFAVMLEARHLTVIIGPQTVLTDVSLALAPGEMVAVVGPNGAGKSTLIKTLCGEVVPVQGTVLLAGRRLSIWARRERAQVMAVLPQASALAFPFTVLEVVLMGRTPHLRSAETPHVCQIALAALATVGMVSYAQRLYPTLSGGERQRVQLARILAQIWEAPPCGARYLLLDEPTASLELAYQHSALATARNFARQRVGVLAVLHDLNLAAQYADRIVMLKEGQLLGAGKPHEVLTPELIRSAFALPVLVLLHPHLTCPLVVPIPGDSAGDQSSLPGSGLVVPT
jgi:iron complex transport system ATP-binding protein